MEYMSASLPRGVQGAVMTRVDWGTLNKRQELDSGVIFEESNITTDFAPCLAPSQMWVEKSRLTDDGDEPISMFGFSKFLFIVYRGDKSDGSGKYNGLHIIDAETYSLVDRLNISNKSAHSGVTDEQRSIVKFNVYTDPSDPITTTVESYFLVFPDGVSVKASNLEVGKLVGSPKIKHATVHLSRVFGVDESKLYVSGFNNYANWTVESGLEDLTEINFERDFAQVTPVMANTRSTGMFTGITTYYGHVMAFKSDYIHEVVNNKYPFRIQDICAEGAVDGRCILEVAGRLIFVDRDGVKVFTGGKPRVISHGLNIDRFTEAVAGTDGRRYFLYCKTGKGSRHVFVYDTMYDLWSEQGVIAEVLSFAHTDYGMFALGKDGVVYKLDSEDYRHDWYAVTDLYLGRTVDIKHVNKLQIMADMHSYSSIKITLIYDGGREPERVVDFSFPTVGKIRKIFRVIPRKTADYGFKIKIEGTGLVKLYQMEVGLKSGGELVVGN